MKASWGYRASNRYVAPTKDVTASVEAGAHSTVRVRLNTNERTTFLLEMAPGEAEALATWLRHSARVIKARKGD